MGTRALIFIHCFLLHAKLYAQQSAINARDLALSYSAVVSINSFAVAENIASLRASGPGITLTGNNRYVKELSSFYVSAIHYSEDKLTLYAGMGRLGKSVYAEQFYEAGVAHKLTKSIRAGIKLRFYQWIIGESGYPGSSALLPDINLAYIPNKQFAFGVIIRNPVRSRMSASASERLPSAILTGITYSLSRKVTLTLAGRQADRMLSLQSGIEYQAMDWVFLRAGMQSSPTCQSFGFGLKHKRIYLDAGVQMGMRAGNTSSVSLTFLL